MQNTQRRNPRFAATMFVAGFILMVVPGMTTSEYNYRTTILNVCAYMTGLMFVTAGGPRIEVKKLMLSWMVVRTFCILTTVMSFLMLMQGGFPLVVVFLIFVIFFWMFSFLFLYCSQKFGDFIESKCF